ncbi:MAG: YigZ family protein [Candidatus Woesearchaeota archaeon]|jgi:putative IMPACT (imprinted ancient) family translation regulator|nr:YigZ family protein [Candidatus Woesearchaeota archaeon]
MKLISETKFTVKKSKFFAFLYEITNEEDIENILSEFNQKHKKANHICVGIKLDSFEKFKNDKEVGQPGKILLEILKENKLDNHVLIVVRYFGGIKLGQGGVQRAFREIGREALKVYT